jgi:regulator of protease activity HflC (stomatin/prohibitin superfamily)
VTPALCEEIVKSGELNTSNHSWDLFRGRYGGIRELDLEAMAAEAAAEAEREAKKAAKAAEREAKKAAKAAAQTVAA